MGLDSNDVERVLAKAFPHVDARLAALCVRNDGDLFYARFSVRGHVQILEIVHATVDDLLRDDVPNEVSAKRFEATLRVAELARMKYECSLNHEKPSRQDPPNRARELPSQDAFGDDDVL